MEFEEYYNRLGIADGESILISGDKSLFIALFMAGRMSEEHKHVDARALVGDSAPDMNLNEALAAEKKDFPAYVPLFERGYEHVSYGRHDLQAQTTTMTFTTALFRYDHWDFGAWPATLTKLNALLTGPKKVLLELPFETLRPVVVVEKGLFKKRTTYVQFREYLCRSGLQVDSMDIVGQKVIVIGHMGALPKNIPAEGLVFRAHADMGEEVIAWLRDSLLLCRDESQFAVRSQDGQFIYMIVVYQDIKGDKVQYAVKFLDGSHEKTEQAPAGFARSITIIVMPNFPLFQKEIEDRGILLINRERILDIYGDKALKTAGLV